MKKEIIETGFCPYCKEPLSHNDIIRYNNDFEELDDVLSQEVECSNCKIKFEIIFAPISINEYLGEKCLICGKVTYDFEKHRKITGHGKCKVILNKNKTKNSKK